MFTPSTIVRLLQNVDISADYKNTFSFGSTSAQASFFSAKTKTGCAFTDFTYQRKESVLKVKVNIETLWNVNYLMFQNSNFGIKWFYAFITDMQYVNDNVTSITFDVDVMQTWLFDLDIKNCYVEREHVSNDTIGLHLIDENLNTGEYISDSATSLSQLDDLAIVVSTTADSLGNDVQGEMYSGVYSGNAYYASSNYEFVNSFIVALAAKPDAINNIFMMPSILINNFEDPIRVTSPTAKTLNYSLSKNLTTLDGYTPVNKKLLSFPFNFMEVTNNHGEASIYKYEYSNVGTMDFFVSCDIAPNPIVYMVPMHYKNLTYAHDELITLSGYPMCNWTTDIYKSWIAQNSVSNAVNIGGSGLALGVGIATVNPIAIAGGVLGVASTIGNFYEKSLLPNPIKGQISGSGNVALGIQHFSIYGKTIRHEYAKMIDDYFNMYGYKVNELKTPSYTSRLNWNYLKLVDVNIFGNIPNKHIVKIHEIFKNGLTFWHNDNVGNYNRANTII